MHLAAPPPTMRSVGLDGQTKTHISVNRGGGRLREGGVVCTGWYVGRKVLYRIASWGRKQASKARRTPQPSFGTHTVGSMSG